MSENKFVLLRRFTEDEISISAKKLIELIDDTINKAPEEYRDEVRFELQEDDPVCLEAILYYYRPETAEEEKARLLEEKNRLEQEYREYLRLKMIYEAANKDRLNHSPILSFSL